MAGCCDPSGYPTFFNRRLAERDVRVFRDKGLDSTAGPMVEALTEIGLDEATVLEVGAGAGTALVSLLEAGAASAVGIDISPHYQDAARSLFSERGFADVVAWHTGDFVEMAGGLGTSDVGFLNRVVCCYPDMEALVDAATAKSTRMLALAYPRKRLFNRAIFRLINVWMRIRGNTFRVFLHDPSAIGSRAQSAGFQQAASGTTPLWHWTVWTRNAN